jgi:hypothetical protein
MEYTIWPKAKQIDDILNRCAEQEDKGGSAVPSMSYEQGVKAGIEWLTNEGAASPLDD